ncbi:MAG: glycerate kinase [Cyclobacteriaceae bacterium]|nr:glycerate kinase [Cyclobacteriaceae bacterium]
MKILIAPDSFKESLSATDAAKYIVEGIKMADPDAVCISVPLADGGEGTVDALVQATGGSIEKVRVMDPIMREIDSYFGILGNGKTAVIEMAAASGLGLLEVKERDPLVTTTFGTGQLISAALDKGCRTLIIGIGGSATNDGGAGMAQALGVSLLDKNGKAIGKGGGSLNGLESVDDRGIDQRLKNATIIVASDVKNPLCGEKGASATYGPQKGATERMIRELDNNLAHFGDVLEKKYRKKIIAVPGSGAAGGLGAGLMAFLDATLEPGFEVVKNITHLENLIREVDLVITGEGRIDEQTVFGKTPQGVAMLAKKYHVPVIGVAGSLGPNYQALYKEGFDVLISIIDKPMTLENAIDKAAEMLKFTAYNLVRSIIIGAGLK